MCRNTGPKVKLQIPIALWLVLISTSVAAQDANSYQLPPSPTPTPTAAGPVVTDAPPPRIIPTQAPTPVILIAPPPTRAETAPTPVVRPNPSQNPAPTARPAPSATPTPSPVPGLPANAQTTEPQASPPPLPSTQTPTHQPEGMPWPWIAVALALILAAGAWLLWRRQNTGAPSVQVQPPVLPITATPKPLPAARKPDAPRPVASPIALDLVAIRMSASLVNATLSYRLIITCADTIESLVVRGDMTSAHASRPTEDQLGLGDAPILHRTDRANKDEAVELKGEIRLPLAAITPINHGTAALFVPLVRLEVHGTCAGQPFTLRTAYVIGVDDRAPDERLRPFRLDAGPRVYSELGRRALVVPAYA